MGGNRQNMQYYSQNHTKSKVSEKKKILRK